MAKESISSTSSRRWRRRLGADPTRTSADGPPRPRLRLALASVALALPWVALAQIALPNATTFKFTDVRIDLGLTQLVLPEAKLNGTHTIEFVSSTSHAEGTVLRAGTTVHNCFKSVSGQLVVNGHVTKPPVTLGVTVGPSTSWVPVHFFNVGPQTVTKPVPALPLGSGQPVTVGLSHGHPSTGFTERTFHLVLNCRPLQPPEPGSAAAGSAAVAPPLNVTRAKQATPGAAGGGSPAHQGIAPQVNVKAPLACKLHWNDKFAEVRPQIPWANAPARVQIIVHMTGTPVGYPTPQFDYFKLPPLWSPGGPHARVHLQQPKPPATSGGSGGGTVVGQLDKPGAPLPTCSATYQVLPEVGVGHALTP